MRDLRNSLKRNSYNTKGTLCDLRGQPFPNLLIMTITGHLLKMLSLLKNLISVRVGHIYFFFCKKQLSLGNTVIGCDELFKI